MIHEEISGFDRGQADKKECCHVKSRPSLVLRQGSVDLGSLEIPKESGRMFLKIASCSPLVPTPLG